MELITSRFLLQEFGEEDYQALRDMSSRPKMHPYERNLPSEAETRRSLDEFIKNQY
jgi:RimJ/RimL family protein N-acetyltransferase